MDPPQLQRQSTIGRQGSAGKQVHLEKSTPALQQPPRGSRAEGPRGSADPGATDKIKSTGFTAVPLQALVARENVELERKVNSTAHSEHLLPLESYLILESQRLLNWPPYERMT